MTYLKLLGIEVPVATEEFCTPQIDDVLRFYPEWKRLGGEWSIQGYFGGFCTALEKWERENGVPYKDRMERAVQHFGPWEIGRMLEQYGGEINAATT